MPGQAGDLPADQRDDQHVRPGRRLGDGVEVGEGRIAQPLMVVDDNPVHFGQQRGRPAECDEGEQREFEKEVDDSVHFRPSFQ